MTYKQLKKKNKYYKKMKYYKYMMLYFQEQMEQYKKAYQDYEDLTEKAIWEIELYRILNDKLIDSLKNIKELLQDNVDNELIIWKLENKLEEINIDIIVHNNKIWKSLDK